MPKSINFFPITEKNFRRMVRRFAEASLMDTIQEGQRYSTIGVAGDAVVFIIEEQQRSARQLVGPQEIERMLSKFGMDKKALKSSTEDQDPIGLLVSDGDETSSDSITTAPPPDGTNGIWPNGFPPGAPEFPAPGLL